MTNGCFQEVIPIPQISYSELTSLRIIGQGGFGKVYQAKHGRFDTIAYKELAAEITGDRYSTNCSVMMILHLKQLKSVETVT